MQLVMTVLLSGFCTYFSDHNLNSLSSLKYLFNLHIYSSQTANAVVAYIHANYCVAFICLLFAMLEIAYVDQNVL